MAKQEQVDAEKVKKELSDEEQEALEDAEEHELDEKSAKSDAEEEVKQAEPEKPEEPEEEAEEEEEQEEESAPEEERSNAWLLEQLEARETENQSLKRENERLRKRIRSMRSGQEAPEAETTSKKKEHRSRRLKGKWF